MEWTAIPCRKATELMVAREDRPLTVGERLGLGVHLRLCGGCQVFERQMHTLRQTLNGWRSEPSDDLRPPGTP
jgi:hypothetical protein